MGNGEELGGEDAGEAVGLMEMLGIVAILLGSLAGGFLIDTVAAFVGGAWSAAVLVLGVLATGCAAAVLAFRSVADSPLLHQLS